jgi:Ran GTPase-activating protein (RanGAP) involved in mRNA processing and transport
MNYTFWYGGYNITDVDWLLNAMSTLNRNVWPADRPVFFDGASWSDKYSQEAAINLMVALKDNTSAATWIVRNVTLDPKGEMVFNSVLETNAFLKTISLTELRGSHGQLMAVPVSLFKNTTLEEITLQQCSLDQAGSQALGQMLRRSRSLKSLTLRKVSVERGGLAPIMAALAESKSLRQLTLGAMELSGSDLREFLSAAAVNTSLTVLRIETMSLDITSAPMLARILRQNKHLTELSLRKNNLTGDCFQVIVQDGLIRNQTLTKLQLSYNPVGDDGAKHLIAGLSQNTGLRELCLTQTEIWREGCLAFSQALPTFKGLRKLSLDGNEMGDCVECGSAILKSLEENVVIHQVVEGLPRLLRGPQKSTWIQIDLLLRMNKAKRRVLVEPGVPSNLLPRVLHSATSQPDVLYCLLRGMPNAWAQEAPQSAAPLQKGPKTDDTLTNTSCFDTHPLIVSQGPASA